MEALLRGRIGVVSTGWLVDVETGDSVKRKDYGVTTGFEYHVFTS